MQKKVRENLLFVAEDNWTRFKKPILWTAFALFLWFGISTVFGQIDRTLSAVEIAGYHPENTVVGASIHAEPQYVSDDSLISIPAIGVQTPLIFIESTNPKDFYGALKEGVTHYPSALPGQPGTAIVLGHSAPTELLRKRYNGVFSDLQNLVPGDEIIVQYDRIKYRYVVEGQEVLQRGQNVPKESVANAQPTLILLSCWPPGIDNKRLMVKAKLSSVYTTAI